MSGVTPVADYSCNSPKCRTEDGAQPVYELPLGSVRCPKCGSKRITRLFNKVAVVGLKARQPDPDWRASSNSALRRSDALLTDGFDDLAARKTSAREMPTFGAGSREREVSLPGGRKFIAPTRQEVAQMFGLGGKGAPLTQMEVMREIKRDRLSVPAVLHQLNQKPVPTVVVGRPK